MWDHAMFYQVHQERVRAGESSHSFLGLFQRDDVPSSLMTYFPPEGMTLERPYVARLRTGSGSGVEGRFRETHSRPHNYSGPG